MEWASEYCLYRMQESFYGLFNNFPNKWLGRSLRLVIFPLGRAYKYPADKLTSKAAAILATPSDARDRLTEGLFIPEDEDQAVAQLEKALELIIGSYEIEKKLHKARKAGQLIAVPGEPLHKSARDAGVITAEEADYLQQTAQAQRNVIMVDDFDPKEV